MRRLGGQLTRGLGSIELALIVPVLVFIAFGALDLGRVFSLQIALTNAAREGARYCAVNPSAPSGLADRLSAELGSYYDMLDATIPAPECVAGAGQASVTLQARLQPITPLIGQLAGGALTVAASATMPA
jgi:Flp pilus assembly protein TadG